MSERIRPRIPAQGETSLSRRRALSREVNRLTAKGNIKEVAIWWNENVGMHFEEDIQGWVTNQFTKMDAKSNWANDAGSAIDESEEENRMFKAFKVARGRHIVSDVVVEKFVGEAKGYARRHRLNEGIAMGYVRDRLTAEGGLFDILGVTTEEKRGKLMAMAA